MKKFDSPCFPQKSKYFFSDYRYQHFLKQILNLVIFISLVTMAFVIGWQLNFSWNEIKTGLTNLNHIVNINHNQLDINFWTLTGKALWETLQMAYLGTFLGVILAMPLIILAARDISNPVLVFILRSIFGFLRATPSLLWAIIAVMIVGLGPLAGTMAIMLVTIGYFGKLGTDAIEAIPINKTHSLLAIGAKKTHLIRFVYWPLIRPKLIEITLFLFEYNIRHSTILGVVGAGGIGFYISGYLKWLEYGLAVTLILIIFAIVLVLEIISAKIKKYLID